MSTVIPMRPFHSALRECRLSGHVEWRADAIKLVKRELRDGFDGLGVARLLQDQRLNQVARKPGGVS